MSDRRMTGAIAGIVAIGIAAVAIAVYFGARYGMARVETMLAREQMAIFAEMRDRALKAEPKEAAGYLRYAVEYYPSGTKQRTGSPRDRMVEEARSKAVRRIIDHLRERTGKDLGDAPEPWIAAYGTD